MVVASSCSTHAQRPMELSGWVLASGSATAMLPASISETCFSTPTHVHMHREVLNNFRPKLELDCVRGERNCGKVIVLRTLWDEHGSAAGGRRLHGRDLQPSCFSF